MKRLSLVLLATAALAAPTSHALAQAVPSESNAMFAATTLSLSAYGETRIAPDMATITVGVQTQAATAAEAMRANRERMSAMVATLRGAGIAERDIQTSNINLNPQYAYRENQPPRLTGYQASNDVTITARDLARLGPTIDAVVAAGANQINGIAFGLQNPKAAEDQARRAAVQALADKAALYAQATSHRVQRLVNLAEGGGYTPQPPRPMMRMMAEAAAQSAPTPVEPGELRVRIDVTGIYELAR